MSVEPFERFLTSKALENCLEKNDFSQIGDLVARHGMNTKVAQAHLAIKLDTERVDIDDRRNFLLSVFAFLGCIASGIQYVGYIMESNQIAIALIDSAYILSVLCTLAQVISAYMAYGVCSEDKKQRPLRKLYVYLKNAEHFNEGFRMFSIEQTTTKPSAACSASAITNAPDSAPPFSVLTSPGSPTHP